jgi:hypothetical protein
LAVIAFVIGAMTITESSDSTAPAASTSSALP